VDSSLLVAVLEKEVKTNGVEKSDVDLTRVAKLIQNRLTLLTDVWQEANFFFIAPKDYDEKAVRKQWKDDTAKILSSVAELIDSADETTADTLGVLIKSYANDNGIGLGKIMAPLRIALVGSLRGPDVFEICSTIGVQNSISRINTAIKNLSV
jgi:glutamyl-tRNA synthetase